MERRSEVAVGIDLGGTKIASALVDGEDRILFSRRRPTLRERGPDAIIADVVEAIREAAAESGGGPLPVGVAVCGQVARDSGVVRASPNLAGWHDVPFRSRLEDAVGYPVAVANDGNLIALGEWRASPDPDRVLVAVYVGTGVGGGAVLDGRPYLGEGGYAAEIGHMTIVVDGRPCPCGNRGCLEAYAGGRAIAQLAREAVTTAPENGSAILEEAGGPDDVSAEALARAYDRGDRLAGELVREIGKHLGAGLVGVANAFNPGHLVLGGGVIEGLPDLVDLAADHLRAHALPAVVEQLEIRRTQPGLDAGVIGAATLARIEQVRGASFPEAPESTRRRTQKPG